MSNYSPLIQVVEKKHVHQNLQSLFSNCFPSFSEKPTTNINQKKKKGKTPLPRQSKVQQK